MKVTPCRPLQLAAFLWLLSIVFCTCYESFAAEPERTVEQWDLFELTLKGPSEGNPFVDVRLSAIFTSSGTKVEVQGFYDGDGSYKVRFMPRAQGVWTYETRSNVWGLTAQSGVLRVLPPSSRNHGPLHVANTYHFAYADGTPFRQLGTTSYCWTHSTPEVREQTLKTLASQSFNKIRMCVMPKNNASQTKDGELGVFPYLGKPPMAWDLTRFDVQFFQRLDQCIVQLRDLGIEADLILFHPYGKRWGFESMGAEADECYLRYVVSRYGAYRNVWWSMANEYDLVKTKTEAEWDRCLQIVQQADPFHHLSSIHHSQDLYDYNKPWVTHASIQNGAAVESMLAAQLYRDVWRKPVVYDEVKYEGNWIMRWGQLSGREMVHRFWCGTVAGNYVGHSEVFQEPEGGRKIVWLADGGTLRGESPARLAFLRKIMEEGPTTGIDPVDKWQAPYIGGKAGEYYLLYFGRETPKSWQFQLPRHELGDGLEFKVEIVDTWEMTITPVEGVFVTKRKDRYHFLDEKGRSITLPDKPQIALRIQRVGGNATKRSDDRPVD